MLPRPSLLATLLIGALAGALAWRLSLPAPFLTGPALAVSVASLAGLRTALPGPLRSACFTVLGVGLGAGLTPETLGAATAWPLSLVLLMASLATIVALAALVLRRMFGYDRATATLSAIPGHLSFVLALAERLPDRDATTMALVQSLRVLALTLLVPVALLVATGIDLARPPDLGADMDLPRLVVLIALSGVLGAVLAGIGVPASYLLAGFALSAFGHLGGLTPGDLPAVVAVPAFGLMGVIIGSRFSGVTASELRRALGAGAAVTATAVAVSAAGAGLVTMLLGLPFAQTLVAFAPGGLETMAALAILTGADTAYVAAHHAARMAVLSVAIPLLAQRVGAFGR